MLDQIARHGMFDLDIQATGDLEIDAHHTVEDIGITLGQAFAEAVGDKRGIRRYDHAYVPLDEALSRVVVDFSGRPGLEYSVNFSRSSVGDFDVDLFFEFFHSEFTIQYSNDDIIIFGVFDRSTTNKSPSSIPSSCIELPDTLM